MAAFIAGALMLPVARKLRSRLRKVASPVSATQPVDLLQYERRTGYFAAFPSDAEIVCIGDSRIEHADWNEILGRSGICNRGISGDTTEGVTKRLQVSLPSTTKLCIIQAGVNDAWRGVAVDTIRESYEEIIRYVVSELNAELIVTAVVLVDQARPELNRRITELNSALADSCNRPGVHWLDLNQALAPAGYLDPRFTDDGTHFAGAAYAAIAQPIRAAVDRILPARGT